MCSPLKVCKMIVFSICIFMVDLQNFIGFWFWYECICDQRMNRKSLVMTINAQRYGIISIACHFWNFYFFFFISMKPTVRCINISPQTFYSTIITNLIISFITINIFPNFLQSITSLHNIINTL